MDINLMIKYCIFCTVSHRNLHVGCTYYQWFSVVTITQCKPGPCTTWVYKCIRRFQYSANALKWRDDTNELSVTLNRRHTLIDCIFFFCTIRHRNLYVRAISDLLLVLQRSASLGPVLPESVHAEDSAVDTMRPVVEYRKLHWLFYRLPS